MLYKIKLYWSLMILLLPVICYAQSIFPPRGVVFTDEVVPRIDILIDQDSLANLLDDQNVDSDHEYKANFIWDDGSHLDTIKEVGFRLRGNTSRVSSKKSFKVKFTTFGNKKFYGLSDLNLNGEHNDPSILRSKLNWDLMAMAGIEGSRANHVRLYINGEYRGVYVNVESVDENYFKARNKDSDGQLFKCFYGSDLTYKGNNPVNYSNKIYEAANHKDNPDVWALIDVLKILEKPTDPSFVCNIEQVMDVDEVLRRMAFEVLIGHWDNLIYNINNAYLFFNPATKRMEVLSYDLDNTYGVDWFGIDWSTRNIYAWSWTGKSRPLYNNLLSIPNYKQRYSVYMKEMLDKFFNPTFMTTYTEQIKNRISPFVANDYYASLDYGYNFDDFNQSFTKAIGKHVKKGLYEYVKERHTSALNQLQINTLDAYGIRHNVTWKESEVAIDLKVGGQKPTAVRMIFKLDDGDWQSLELNDLNSGDSYNAKIDKSGATHMKFYFNMIGNGGKITRYPFCDTLIAKIGYLPTPQLYINEYMSDNEIIADDASEYEDWIEIYNGSDETIYLGDKYLTDNAQLRNKWPLPALDLEAYQFLLIWADEDGSQGFDHANFKLEKKGEFIGIFDSEDNAYAPIDTIRYEDSSKNKSAGRWPDGGVLYKTLSSPTPGASNVTNNTSNLASDYEVSIEPTLASDKVIIRSSKCVDKIIITNSSGVQCKVIKESLREYTLDVSEMMHGQYYVSIFYGDVIVVRRFCK